MQIKIDDSLTLEYEPEHVFEDGLDWWEIFPGDYVKEIVRALKATGCEVFEWEGPDRSVGVERGFVAFHFPHTEPDGTCQYMIENILAKQAKGNDRLYTDMLRYSMIPDEWIVSERTRIYGALKRIAENNRPVHFTEEQAAALKTGIREAAGVNLNTGFLARKFAQIAAEVDAEDGNPPQLEESR